MLQGPEKALITVLLAVLMFGMGASLSREQVQVVLTRPRAFAIGSLSQFFVMPLLAYALAVGLGLPAASGLSLLLMGTCPGGATSNLFAHLSKADVALSIAMTAFSKLLGLVMMPLWLALLGGRFLSADVTVPYRDVVLTLALLLVPVGLAMLGRARFGAGFAARAEQVGSFAGMAVLVVLVVLGVFRNRALFAQLTAAEYGAAVGLGVAGLVFGRVASRLAGLDEPQTRTVAFETGVQNSALCFAVIVTSFPDTLHEALLRLPLLYALFILVEASLLVALYRALDRRTGAA